MRSPVRQLGFIAGFLAAASSAPAQDRSLTARIQGVGNGEVRLAFAPREDVCGDGEGMIRFRDHESIIQDNGSTWTSRGNRRYRPVCVDGPVRVRLTVRDGRVQRVRTYVGGEWSRGGSDVTDLGDVSCRAAAATFIELARRSEQKNGSDLIFPAILADSVTVWRDLLELARDEKASKDGRKSAVFWLSQEAGDAVTRELGDFVEDDEADREVREAAVFGLSQRPKDEGVPVLIRVARTNRDPKIRRQALFWLGQSEDPRALALFEEILTKQN